MKERLFAPPVERAVEEGMVAAALVDRDGRVIALAGALTDDEAMPLAALVMYRLKSDDLAARLFTGEVLTLALDDRNVVLGIAKRQLFVLGVVRSFAAGELERARELIEAVEIRLRVAGSEPQAWTPGGGDGGGGAGPAELPLIELGITVPRAKA